MASKSNVPEDPVIWESGDIDRNADLPCLALGKSLSLSFIITAEKINQDQDFGKSVKLSSATK